MKEYIICILLVPLLGALINCWRLSSRKLGSAAAIGSTSCIISFFIAAFMLFHILDSSKRSITVVFFKWLSIDSFSTSFSFLIDPLSVLMLLVITGVGSLIHIFSVYYMSEDKHPAKYFSYLNLFIFSMMVLVLAEDLLLMFIGWEAVGLCSYLLIGFWFTDYQKAAAGMKAFLFNRLGDIGFLIGLFILVITFDSLNIMSIKEQIPFLSVQSIVSVKWACLFLFLGATGKSAQIPLYLWLPSAMAGPTPVSALIHAATMVTAGVYLIVRLNFLFMLSPVILSLISYIGVFTALWAAIIACTQKDIKKVLAYSTVSQLGYMFLAVGMKAFVPAIFHLVTHAFFKALLFLSAGSVIHALHGEQDIYRMGGLKKFLPWTWFGFLFGFLAIVGMPPFSGFFSKDEILWQSLAQSSFLLFILAFITALLTAFYMTRLFVLIFYGENRFESSGKPIREGLFCAIFPLLVLAMLSLVSGVLGIPHVLSSILPFHPPHFLESFLKTVVSLSNTSVSHYSWWSEISFMVISTVCMILVILCTIWFYLGKLEIVSNFKARNIFLFNLLNHGFFLDSFYYQKVVQPILNLSHELKNEVELKFVQGFIFFIQKWLIKVRELFEILQNKKLQSYAFYMILGIIAIILSVFKGL